MRQLIESKDDLQKRFNLLTQTIGVGENTALALMAFLSALGHINRRKIAALVGVAPFARDSGTISGYRYVRGGKKRLNMLTVGKHKINCCSI